jgi:hypothetical protein
MPPPKTSRSARTIHEPEEVTVPKRAKFVQIAVGQSENEEGISTSVFALDESGVVWCWEDDHWVHLGNAFDEEE